MVRWGRGLEGEQKKADGPLGWARPLNSVYVGWGPWQIQDPRNLSFVEALESIGFNHLILCLRRIHSREVEASTKVISFPVAELAYKEAK